MTEYALRLANGADTAPRVRAGDALGMTPNGAVRARAGLRPDGGGVVTVPSGTMTVSVSPFSCWVDASPAGQVGYPFVCDAAKTLTIDPGDATLARVDVVAVVVRENAYDGGGATSATLQIVKGTPGAGAPALPTSASLALREVNVPAGTSAGGGGLSSSNLGTDRRVYTVASGGTIPCTSATRPGSPRAGMAIFETDTFRHYIYDGAAWRWVGGGWDPTAARGYATAATAMTVGTATTIALAGESYDYGNNFAGNAYTAPRAGLLDVRGRVTLNNGTAGQRLIIAVYVNGAEATRGQDIIMPSSTNTWGGVVADTIAVNAGDVVTLRANLVSGTAYSTEAGAALVYMTCRLLP